MYLKFIILVFIFILFNHLNAKEVNVGVFNHPPLVILDKNSNNPKGIFIDILEDISKEKNWKLNYSSGSFKENYEKLTEEKIDVLVSFTSSPKRMENFDFNNLSVISTWAVLFSSNKLNINNLKELTGKRISGMQNDIHFIKFLEKINNNGINITKVEKQSHKKAFEAVKSGEADIVVTEYFASLIFQEKYKLNKTPLVFYNHPIGYGVKKDKNSYIIKEIDNYLQREKTNFNSSYYKHLSKYFNQSYINKLIENSNGTYNIEENRNKENIFLKKNNKIRFRVNKNKPPFEFEKNGKAEGILVDYVKLSAKKIGLEADFILNNDSLKDAYTHINTSRKNYDTLLSSVKNDQREKEFSYGMPYLSYPIALITNKNVKHIKNISDITNETIVLEKGYLSNKWIKKDYPSIKVINKNTTKEALDLVNKSRTYVYIGNLGITNYMKNNLDMRNLKITGITEYGNVDFSFVAPKQWPELSSLLSKGFMKITPLEHVSIQQKWFTYNTIEKVDYSLIWKILSVSLFILIISFWWSNKLRIEKIKTNKALIKLKESQEEILKQQQALFNQSKIASLGEMLENIAHQWRQPLSVITTSASGIKLQKEYNTLDNDSLEKHLNAINTNAMYLSKTIDTFRNFIKEGKNLQDIILQKILIDTFVVLNATLENNHIKLINNIDYSKQIKLKIVADELSQVIMNIVNNAKDIIIEKKINKPWIKVELKEDKNKIIISIEDNAGGIPNSIKTNIFDPYFTTKHKSQGTGLGLHMSYRIVNESLKGKLYENNTKNGAKFYIELPKNN